MEYWFKPKAHGYGATPVNWKGWAAIAGFILATSVIAIVFMVMPAVARSGPTLVHYAGWLLSTAGAAFVFWRLCLAKTDGEWRWR